MTNTIVKRTTLIVRDIRKSTRWYQEVLGMTVYYDDQVILGGKGMATGKKGDVTHLIILKCNDPVIGMIGLLQWIDPTLPAPDAIPDTVNYGQPTFVVDTDHIKEVFAKAVALDTLIYSEPHQWSVRGATGDMIEFLGMSLFDPDGHFFEINQRLN
jgi:catechol 2,3-dioxygenase-like lactoylglutathione lyase family enzyme|tara:strand:- start:460 stop:927 length:468 start_codon:yes stop_codon:yes gene_type:complete